MQLSMKKPSKPRRVDPTLDAMDSIRRIVREIRLFSHTTKRSTPISGAQLFVLQSLADEPGMSLKDLAARTLTDQSSVSVVVSRLVAKGMIKRRIARDDARRTELELSARGRALLRDAPPALQSRLIAGLRSLPRSELASVARALRKIVVHLGADGATPAMFFEAESTRARSTAMRASAAATRGSASERRARVGA
jgi:DNA-binding MarR family transcriptional regulator